MLSAPKEINSSNLQNYSGYVKITGKITFEKDYDEFKSLTLQDNYGKIQVSCFGCPRLINKSVAITGKIQEYRGKKQILAELVAEE